LESIIINNSIKIPIHTNSFIKEGQVRTRHTARKSTWQAWEQVRLLHRPRLSLQALSPHLVAFHPLQDINHIFQSS